MRDRERAEAALTLNGYVIGLIKAGEVRACHVEPLTELIQQVRKTHGLSQDVITVGDHSPEPV